LSEEIFEEGYGWFNEENDAELPVWRVGDRWSYQVEIEGGMGEKMDFDISMDTLTLEVVEIVDNELYCLDMTVPKGQITGSGRVDFDVLTLQGELIDTRLDGMLYVKKSTLEIVDGEATVDGYVDKLIDIHFTVDLTACFYDADFNRTNFSSLRFPINTGDEWTVPVTYMVLNMTINLLPEPTLLYLYVDNQVFHCTGWDTVTYEDMEYDALKISGSLGETHDLWYSVAAGNIVKLDYRNVPMGFGFEIRSLTMTLLDTTYYVETTPPLTPGQPSGPTVLNVGESGNFTTNTSDPDGDSIRYIYDWDDGSKSMTTFLPSGETALISHMWTRKGSYSVKVKARDKYGGESGWSVPLNVTVLNEAPGKPNQPSGPTSGNIKQSYVYITSTVDPDGHQVKYGWDWDGNDVVDEWTALYGSGEEAQTLHTWYQKGNYAVKVKAMDEYGEESPWSDPLGVSIPKPRTERVDESPPWWYLVCPRCVQVFG
jgi:hypothetical protein